MYKGCPTKPATPLLSPRTYFLAQTKRVKNPHTTRSITGGGIRGASSISDSLLGIEAADVALLVVRVLAAAIPSEDYWRFSDVSRGVRAAPPRAPTSERLRQGPQPHTSRCVRPRTAVRAATPPSGYLLSEVFAGVRAAPESSDERDVRGTEIEFTGLTQPKLKFGARSAP